MYKVSLYLNNLDKSCINIFILEGNLNYFLVSSTYFGLTNSSTNPFISDIILRYGFKLNTRHLNYQKNHKIHINLV